MPLLLGAVLHFLLTAAGVTATVLALALGKLMLAGAFAAFFLGAWLRLKRARQNAARSLTRHTDD